jgi:hypothetical protein
MEDVQNYDSYTQSLHTYRLSLEILLEVCICLIEPAVHASKGP